MFQTESYCGGFDADEREFTFSYYDTNSKEWWFQLSLETIEIILNGTLESIDLKEPN